MAECLIRLLEHVKEVGTSIVTRHIGYWWFFEDNIQGLRDAIRHLETEKRNMNQKISEAELRAESATPEVGNWLIESTQKLEEATTTLQRGNELERGDILLRYLVGKSAKKTAEDIAKLLEEGKSITLISYPPPPPSRGSLPHEETTEFESRMCIEADIMESLNDDHVRMIAICGAGGVGKTTMVQRIVEKVRNKLFDDVVLVVASQQIDMLKIQKEIAEILGLKLSEETLAGRAHKIRTRLLDSKRKLIIFDDVWKSFDLKDIGVPLENDFEGCKIILTSRLKDVCEEMDADKVFQIEVLDEEEAWRLFREKSRVREDDSELRPIAKAVAAECKGLPIALVPVAEALKYKGKRTWEDSLLQLKRSNPMNFPKVLEDVYKPLKLSYDFLQTESEKLIFLLCCLFPEDYDIPMELLTLYSFGLGILEGIMNIDEGRNRTHHLVETLKNRFMLIDGRKGDHVKMHDVVRDVAIFIGSKERHVFLKSLEVFSRDSPSLDSSRGCRWMSTDISIASVEFPVGSYFPNLHLLMIGQSDFRGLDHASIDYEGMEELKVLLFSKINLGSFPPTLELLKNLKALLLDHSQVRDISVVGELTSLEILRICDCFHIEELPADIGRLNRLRLLELSDCQRLERVAEGVISSLVGLEELKMFNSFNRWGAKVNGSDERNASLLELQFLPKLTCLKIDIYNGNLVAQEICLSQQLMRYQICFTSGNFFDDTKSERKISLNLRRGVTIGNWIHQLVRSTQSLLLSGDGSNYINLDAIESLKQLMLIDCPAVKKIDCKFHVLEQLYLRNLTEVESIADGTISEGSNYCQKLELLGVMGLPKLAHLWRSPNQNVSLANLKKIVICDCPSLRSLFSLETVRSLVQLQVLEIETCDMIEQLFCSEIESNLEDEIIEFPQLTELKIIDCPKLRAKIGKCPNLRTIQLHTFHGLHHLLSSCFTTWNTQLHKLLVSDCDTIEELLVDEIEDEGNRHIIFPKLKELGVRDLPYLTTFYSGVESIKFPKLERIEIINLPRLNKLAPMDSEATHDDHSLHFFCNQKVETPCLETLSIVKLQDTISNIWCRLIPNNFFHKLKDLQISDVNGIRNLMSSSIAENLVNLYNLSIESCEDMIEVVEDDKEVSVTSLFPNLKYIHIIYLHKLKSFCHWKHALEFPSLCLVEILDCPEMETFTLGSLSTPYHLKYSINGGPFEMKDLNDSIRNHFMVESQEGEEKRQKRRKDEKRERM